MDLNYIKKLIKLVETSGIGELELEEEGSKIRIAKQKASSITPTHAIQLPHMASAQQQTAPATPVVEHVSESKPPVPTDSRIHEVKSPIVGTFYRAPAPDAESYVQIGQMVQAGEVLCIVEAMKLMNEIESDISGKIVKACVENGQPVEYNQTLFHIEKV